MRGSRKWIGRAVTGAAIGAAMAFAAAVEAQSTQVSASVSTDVNPPLNVGLTPDFSAPAAAIPPDFAGLSYESSLLLKQNGRYYFGPERQTLLGMFRTLGVHSLRLGGNFSDKPSVPVPQGSDVDRVFAFAKAADCKVIYTVRLRGQTSPLDDAALAKYVASKFGDQLAYLQIGNEPDIYLKPFGAYRDKLVQFAGAIRAESPGAQFCGPSATKESWARQWAETVGKSGPISLITQHAYFGGNARVAEKNPAGARDLLLSPEMTGRYQHFYDSFVPAVQRAGMRYRIEETNSFYNGGAEGVSNSFAAGLWGLDYLYFWASHGATGINFHNGDTVAAGDNVAPCWYASFTRAGDGYAVHPLGYALAAFELGSHGKMVPMHVDEDGGENGLDGGGGGSLTAYGVDSAVHNFYVTLINKQHARTADTVVSIRMPAKYDHGDRMALTAPGNDIAATDGVTLGGAAITNDAGWQGSWTALAPPTAPGTFTIHIPPASAMVLRLISE